MKTEIYILRRESGDYAVRRPGSERASAILRTRDEAVSWVREYIPDAVIYVESIRETSVGGRDRWRRVA